MPIFEEFKLTWQGRELAIAPDRIMQCIAKVEDVITIGELSRAMDKGSLPLGKLAMAFGAVLRHAGARVEDAEVYSGMFEKAGDETRNASAAVVALVSMMIPPSALKKAPKDASAGKAAAGETTS